jgi:DNA-binding transcriptional regulator YiaG
MPRPPAANLLGTYFLKPLLQLFPGRGVGAEALEPVLQLAAKVAKFICGQRIQRMSVPNAALRAARMRLHLSQDELARAMRQAGDRAGEPNGCTKRIVQRWEAGLVKTPRGPYARALEYVTGQTIQALGFESADQKYGLDPAEALGPVAGAAWLPDPGPKAVQGPLTGIWISTYEYTSSGRSQSYTDRHHVLLIQHGRKLQVRSLLGSAPSRLVMDLTINGQVITGTWTEETNPNGYYQGSTYHGAIQLLADPTGHRMTGRWVGFGRDFDVNSGPWTLELLTSDTSPQATTRYDTPPRPAQP